jgi:hypothetical protein
MTKPVEPLCGRGPSDLKLSRRSLVAAVALVATAGSSSMARAISGSRNPDAEFSASPGAMVSSASCFLSGTRILTPAGEVDVQDLKIGDRVVTHGGAEREIRWVGKVSFARPDASDWPQHAAPVRIARDAFAPGVPHRELYVSRTHLLYLNGVLVPAGDLENGRTIRAVAPEVDVVHYFHVELDGHDVLVAEGAPCDSLLGTSESRMLFDNYNEYVALYGESAAVAMMPCAPIAHFNGGRSELRSRLRSALAPIVDIRQPMDVVRDSIEARSLALKAA